MPINISWRYDQFKHLWMTS